jgi:hypothetical protein
MRDAGGAGGAEGTIMKDSSENPIEGHIVESCVGISPTPKPRIFLSHIAEEKTLAELIKHELESGFLGQFEVFVSSNTLSIPLGTKWEEVITDALKNCNAMILLGVTPDWWTVGR